MTYLEALLEGAAVEWKPLNEVFEIRTGYTPSKKNSAFWDGGTIPWFRMEDLRAHGGLLSDSIQHITPQAIKSNELFKAGSIILATSATIGEHALLLTDALANQRFTNFNLRGGFADRVLPKFAYYYFFKIDAWCKEHVFTGTFPSVDMKNLRKQLFPLPPLAVQERIVEILDKFTALEAELEAELEARKKQYEYYRNKLLRFGAEVEWRPLNEVFEIRTGYTPSKKNSAFWDGGTIPWFRMEDLRAHGGLLSDAIQHIPPQAVKGKGLFKAGSIILATSATVGEHALLLTDALANQRFTNFNLQGAFADRVLPKFAYYYFFKIDAWCKEHVFTGTFPSVDMKNLRKQLFPLPPLAVQEQIVAILDKFHTLVHSISEGLPAEIALRRRQYEYYRNQLLRFPR